MAGLHADVHRRLLIAAGTGILLWAVLATEARARTRTWAGLAGFVALEAATFVRYTNIVVLGCAAVAVIVAWRLGAARLPAATLGWWLGSVAVFVIGTGIFDDLVYGGPLTTGYQPGEIRFGLGAIAPNLRYMPAHLLQAVPMLVLGLAALAWIMLRWARLRQGAGGARPRRPPGPRGRPRPGRVVARGLGPVRRVLLDRQCRRHDLAVRQILRARARRDLPARRLAGNPDTRPRLAGRPDHDRRHRGDVRARHLVLPRHGRSPLPACAFSVAGCP